MRYRNLFVIHRQRPRCIAAKNWKEIRGMNFAINVSIFPHFDETFADLVHSKEADIVNGTLVCLSNSQVLAVNGPHMQIYAAQSSTTC